MPDWVDETQIALYLSNNRDLAVSNAVKPQPNPNLSHSILDEVLPSPIAQFTSMHAGLYLVVMSDPFKIPIVIFDRGLHMLDGFSAKENICGTSTARSEHEECRHAVIRVIAFTWA